MRTTIVMADAALDHGDGTYSLLRGGLDGCLAGGSAAFVIVVLFDPHEYGMHVIALRIFDGNNKHVMDVVQAPPLLVQKSARKVTMVGRPGPLMAGSRQLVVEVDAKRVAAYEFEVVPPPQTPPLSFTKP